jgi:HK97 family phage major capsid protein
MVIAGLRGMPEASGLTPEEQQLVQRAMAVGTGSAGGFAVPFQLDGTIVPSSNLNINPFRICRQQLITSNTWGQATSGGMTATYAAEAAQATDNSSTLAQPTFAVQRAQSFAPVSYELSEDWDAILDELGSLIQEAKDDLEATKFTTGTGTGEPTGLITAGTAFSGSAGSFTLPDLYNVEKVLPPRFRRRAQWQGHRERLQDIRKFALPESAAPVWEHTPGRPTEVLGYPVNEDSAMTTAVTIGSKILAFGDPQYYVIVDRIGLDVETTSYHYQQSIMGTGSGFPLGQRGVLALWRNTANLLAAGSFRILSGVCAAASGSS